MGPMRSRIALWLAVYELAFTATSVLVGLILLHSSRASPVESVAFIKAHDALDAVLRIWLNNTSSFLIAAVLIVLHPVLGVLATTFTSAFNGQLLASWLAGRCSTLHFVYGNIETQAYIALWLAAARTYYVQKESSNLLHSWRATLRQTTRLLVYAFTVFLVLAVIEVAEVRILG